MSGKAIKALKRQQRLDQECIERTKLRFIESQERWRKNLANRKKLSSHSLYDLEGMKKAGDYGGLNRACNVYRLEEKIKKTGNKHKLKRLYKIFPGMSPEAIAKKNSEEKTRRYWEKQKELNEKRDEEKINRN